MSPCWQTIATILVMWVSTNAIRTPITEQIPLIPATDAVTTKVLQLPVFETALAKRQEADIPSGSATSLFSTEAFLPLGPPTSTTSGSSASSASSSSAYITQFVSQSSGLISDTTTFANGSVTSVLYIYEITGDMYGLGIRISYYVQSACNIIACIVVERGVAELGRSNSAIMALALTVAFGLGIRDPNNRMALEVQLFVALITMISLPILLAVLIQWKKSQQNLTAHGSIIALASIFLTSSGIALWGELNGRYTGLCKLFSGLGGTSVKARAGWNAWVALLALLTVVALTVLVACCIMIWRASASGREAHDSHNRKWIQSQPRMCIAWSIFAVGIWITSVASVQVTIRRHLMITTSLTDRDYGQYISLCVAIGSVCTLTWATVEENCNSWKWRPKRRTPDNDDGENGVTEPPPDPPDDANAREKPNVGQGQKTVVQTENEETSAVITTVAESELPKGRSTK